MIIVNTPSVPNKAITEVHGIARGSTVRARNFGSDIFAGLKNIVGGEISEYTKLQADSREQALQRMQEDAERLGANAIVNVRITTSMVMQGCSEILAWHSSYRKVMALIIGGIILILLIYLIAKRIDENEKKNFEKREKTNCVRNKLCNSGA